MSTKSMYRVPYLLSHVVLVLVQKETEAKLRQTKAEEWNYKGRIDQDGAFLERKEKANQVQSYKATQRETKSKLKDVTQEEDGEMAIRKEQHSREQKWKETGRNQIKTNTNFDMARSLFGGGGGGGGGPAPSTRYEEDEDEAEDEVVEQIQNLAVNDDDDDDDDDHNNNNGAEAEVEDNDQDDDEEDEEQ